MKKLYFMLAAMVFAVAGYLSPQVMASKTVYFVNYFDWTTVNCYTYGNSETCGVWPGAPMDKTGGKYKGKDVYSKTFNDGASYVIFNNKTSNTDSGGTQTAGNNKVSIKDGALYYWTDSNNNGSVSILTSWSYDAVPAPATMYMFGNINGSGNDGWNNKTTNSATKQSGDVYKWNNFVVSQESWFRFIGDSKEYSTDENPVDDKTVTDGVTDYQTKNSGDRAFNIGAGKYNITLKWNNGSPLLTVQKATDPVGTITDYWLRGNFSGWGTADDYKFTPDAKGEEYTLRVNNGKVLCDNEFKVGAAGDDNWESYSTGESSMEVNRFYSDMNSQKGNMKLKSGAIAENTPVTVIFNKKNKTIIFKTENDPEPPTPDKYPVLYLPGDFNSFGFEEAYKFRLAGHTYRLTVKAGTLKDKSFKIADNAYNWQFICGNNNVANINQDYNDVTSGGQADMTLNLSYVNPNTNVNIIVNITDLAAKKANIRFEAVEDNPGQYRTLYMNFLHELGDEALGEDKLETSKPWVRLYNGRLEDWNAVKNWDRCVVHEMKRIGDSQIYRYTLNDEELKSYNNAIFYIPIREHDDNGGNKFYICNANPDNFGNGAIDSEKENYKNGWRNWDGTYWLKYVYCVSGEGLAAQSYITYDEYQKLLPLPKEEIYFTGENVKNIGWDPTQKLVSEKTVDGVAYWKNNPEDSNKGVKFKMSWLHPVDMYNECLSKTLTNQRAWATFNMGLVSVNKEIAKDKNGNTLYTTVPDNPNKNLQVNLNKILPYSDHTAENWFMDRSATDQWLVIDTHEECKSVTLLSFEPNPTLSVNAGEVQEANLDSSQAAMLHEDQKTTGHTFYGEDTNGLVHITSLNTLNATATLKAEFAKLSENGANMTVKYDFYSNGEVFYTTDGSDPNNKEFSFANIAVGDGSTVGARGLYKDNNTNFQFHSKFTNGTLSGDFKAQSPVIQSIGTKGYAVMSDAPETLSAMFAANVTLPANGVVYPDFEVKVNENSSNNYHLTATDKANGGEIVHSNHAVAKQYTWFDKVAYTPATSASDYDHDTHNWTAKLGAENAAWPLYLPDVLKLANDDNEKWYGESGDMNTTLDFTAYAVYPFLIDRKATVTVTTKSTAPRRAALDLNSADHDYHIVLVRIPASTTVELDEKSPLTGIDDIVAPEADAEAVYYTLDGRLAGSNPAAGVYIRRVGNKAEKIYIR